MKIVFPLIVILFSSCGVRVDTSGTQKVIIPDSKQEVVVEYDLKKLVDHFYKSCLYQIYEPDTALTVFESDAVDAEAEKCAYSRLDKFLNENQGFKFGSK